MLEKIRAYFKPDTYIPVILTVFIFLLPIFFVPYSGVSHIFAKYSLVGLVAVLCFLLWLVSLLEKREVFFPKSWIFVGAIAVLFSTLLSSFFSSAVGVSLLGFGPDLASFISLFSAFVLFCLTAVYVRSIKKIFNLYGLFFISFAILAIFHFLRMVFGAQLLSFGGMFDTFGSTPIGEWNDIAIFSGLISVLSLTALQLLKINRQQKNILYVFLGIALLMQSMVGFILVWICVGLVSFVLFVYSFFPTADMKIKGEKTNEKTRKVNRFSLKKIASASFVTCVISCIFIFSASIEKFAYTHLHIPGLNIARYTTSISHVQNISVSPSWGATIDIANRIFSEHAILGTGPNTFTKEWLMYKPDDVNKTVFWDRDFSFGIGIIPTLAITTGWLGVFAWIMFFMLFVMLSIQAFWRIHSKKNKNELGIFLIASLFLLTVYLWIMSIFYVPGIVWFIILFVCMGMFVGILVESGLIKDFSFSLSRSKNIVLASTLVIIALIIFSMVDGYFFSKRFIAAHTFSAGVKAFNGGYVPAAEYKIKKAAGMTNNDNYYRNLSDVQIQMMKLIVNESNKENADQDELRVRFQTTLSNAILSAQSAIKIHKTDYKNWVALARVYESVVPLGVKGAYENSIAAYEEAVKLNPKSPLLQLMLANLELAHQDMEAARNRIARALELKNNYLDAIFLLAQIEINEGDIDKAIASIDKASSVAPNDFNVFFELGFLKYKNKDYQGALLALERAVMLNPRYSNAKYLLGLSYDKLGKHDEALMQFKDLKSLNPENEEVEQILKNLEEGKHAPESSLRED